MELNEDTVWEDGQTLISYKLYLFDQNGNVLAEVNVESATEITNLQFDQIIYGGNGQIEIVGKTGTIKPTGIYETYYEVILLRQAELCDYNSTLDCGQYFCVQQKAIGYWKDDTYFVAFSYANNRYDSEADPSKTRAYIIKVGDSRDYVITKGDGSIYTVGANSDASAGKSLIIVCNGEMNLFTELRIDGAAVAATNYTLQSGSTIVNLSPNYLLTLSVGNHSIQFIYKHGTSNIGSFTIEALKEQKNNDQGNTNTVVNEQGTANKGTSVANKRADSPKTGDQNMICLYLIMLLAAAGMAICVGKNRGRRPGNSCMR